MSNGRRRASRIFDYGANKKINRENSTYGVCPSCGERQALSRQAWHRASRPQCRACGAYLEPSRNAQKRFLLSTRAPAAPKRRCENCESFLRSGNHGPLCSACQN